MIEEALELGFTALGLSGHVDIDPVMDVNAYLTEIRQLQEEYKDKIEILCGGEFDTFYPNLQRDGFDYKIGANHFLDIGAEAPISIDTSAEVFFQLLNECFNGNVYQLTQAYYERVAKVYDQIHCSFVGHFDIITKYNNNLHVIDEDDPRYVGPAMDALNYLLSEDVAFEINTRVIGTGRIYPHKRFLKRIREKSGEILISSDAHNASELTRGFDQAVELAKELGFDHTNYLTMRNGKLEFVPVNI